MGKGDVIGGEELNETTRHGYTGAMRVVRLGIIVLYASYLTNVGLFLLLLPWSDVWARFVLLTPQRIGVLLDSPALRGAVSAFGLLHLILLLAELIFPTSLLRKDT